MPDQRGRYEGEESDCRRRALCSAPIFPRAGGLAVTRIGAVAADGGGAGVIFYILWWFFWVVYSDSFVFSGCFSGGAIAAFSKARIFIWGGQTLGNGVIHCVWRFEGLFENIFISVFKKLHIVVAVWLYGFIGFMVWASNACCTAGMATVAMGGRNRKLRCVVFVDTVFTDHE